MSTPPGLRLQKTLNSINAQLELLAQSTELDLSQLKLVFETIGASDFRDEWPLREVFPLIQAAMLDGLDKTQGKALQAKLAGLYSQSGRPIGVPLNEQSKVEFKNRTFCFTGVFELGTRKECFELVEALGGQPTEGVLKRLDYLVIGQYSCPDWKHTSYGRKIEKALRQNHIISNKHKIKIVSEKFFVESAKPVVKAS